MPNQNNTKVTINTFTGSMKKDLDESYIKNDSWSHARNAVRNTHMGELGTLSDESSNILQSYVPYPYIIGAVPAYEDVWVIFSTDDSFSEIGLFDVSLNKYSKVCGSANLGLKSSHTITGAVKVNFDNTYTVYWDDGLNPSRKLNLQKPPFKISGYTKTTPAQPVYSTEIDTEQLRLADLIDIPVLKLIKSTTGGNLPNGSYQVVVAYLVNGIRATDYFCSEVQGLFSHERSGGGLELSITHTDSDYKEIEVGLVYTSDLKTQAVKIGTYSATSTKIYISEINPTAVAIPIENIPLKTPVYEKSDAMYHVGDYLIRAGVYTEPNYNYQKSANKIIAKWVAWEVEADYYLKGGNKTSYMADENYLFFIEGITNTGATTASYPIPGRVNAGDEKTNVGGADAYEYFDKEHFGIPKKYEVYNTASVESIDTYGFEEGKVIMQGSMGYTETEESYPSQPEVWGELSGKNIRLHRFPDRTLVPLYGNGGKTINILGVKFENIAPFTDFDGNVVENIIGYRILRANREGHKTVIAKGLFNNMRGYKMPDDKQEGLYPNYPYNDLRKDIYLSSSQVTENGKSSDAKALTDYKKDIFTFHSPDTTFKSPSLYSTEVKLDAEVYGTVKGSFDPVYLHPKHRLIEDFAVYTAGIVGTALGLTAINGRTTTYRTHEGDENEVEPKTQLGGSEGLGGLISTASGALGLIGGIGGSGVLASVGSLLGNPIVSMGLNAVTGGVYGVAKGALGKLGGLLGIGGNKDKTTSKREQGVLDQSPTDLLNGNNAFLYTYFLAEGFDKALDIIKKSAPYRQFAYQYNSACFYNSWRKADLGNMRRKITASEYLEPYLQDFDEYRVNNLFRGKSVMVKLNTGLLNPSITDNSRQTIGSLGIHEKPSTTVNTQSSCYYGALKVKQPNQYGQPDSVNQIPVSTEVHSFNGKAKVSSPVLFGGDIYINKFSEKNTMFFFNDWLHGQPDDAEFDYSLSPNLPFPRYWINSQGFNSSEIVQSFVKAASTANIGKAAGGFIGGLLHKPELGVAIGSIAGGIGGTVVGLNAFNNANKPDNYYSLDQKTGQQKKSFAIKNGFFYLFNNGVREFFVESEMNLAYRDWENEPEKKFYSSATNTDLKTLFRSDIIKFTNFYKYDDSLSVTKLLSNYISWNFVLPRDYDPALEKTVYSYQDKALIYSLPQSEEYKGDNWAKFLINNKKNFDSKVTAIKSVGKSGAIIFFDDASPVMFQGVDSQPLDAKILTSEGWTTMGDISTYDKIFGRDGQLHNVLNVYEIGEKPIYRIHFTDGSSVRASNTHKWNVIPRNHRATASSHFMEEVTKSTTELLFKNNERDAIALPTPLEYPKKDLLISPYTMGAMIADGCMTKQSPFFSSTDLEVYERVSNESGTISPKYYIKWTEKHTKQGYSTHLTKHGARRKDSNPFTKEFKRLGLHGKKSKDKFIPAEYFQLSVQQRIDLLKGLMDCDGTICKKGKMSYATISERLAGDVKALVESLGGLASISKYEKNNFSGKQIVEYRVRLRVTFNPFYLKRKAKRFKPRRDVLVRIIKDVVFEGVEYARCIKTDAPDELYLTDNYILTHNTLQTEGGIKITIGDGGLFHQPLQATSNAEKNYEYGSCQSKHSIITTPAGTFWISQNQGKIFQFGQGLKEISREGNKFWFAQFLPSYLTKQFPTYELTDNTVSGVGCIAGYDTTEEVLYFSKVDYSIKPEYANAKYLGNNWFQIDNITKCRLGDPNYFDNASWTASCDPSGNFISFHDWVPELMLSSRSHLLTTKSSGIWLHNASWNSYCNFYGTQYPFEVEIPVSTGEEVTTLKSVEYNLVVNKYYNDGRDKFHILDDNFDRGIIHNSEQCSGMLKFEMQEKNTPLLIIDKIATDNTGVICKWVKSEQKIRFNQFYDLQRNRMEYADYEPQPMFNVHPNGYTKDLNVLAINYQKNILQRKKFRHMTNYFLLRKVNPGDRKYILKFFSTKLLKSFR